jgi:hypothetical protein
MWGNALRICKYTNDGKIAVECLVEINSTQDAIDICARSETGDQLLCVVQLFLQTRHCEAVLDMELAASMLDAQSIKEHGGLRHVGDRRHVVDGARGIRPSEWLELQFESVLQPAPPVIDEDSEIQTLKRLLEGQHHLTEGQRQLTEGQRQLKEGVHQQFRTLTAMIDAGFRATTTHMDALTRSGAAAEVARRHGHTQLAAELEECRRALDSLARTDTATASDVDRLGTTLTDLIAASEARVRDEIQRSMAEASDGMKHFQLTLVEYRVPSVFVVSSATNGPHTPSSRIKSACMFLKNPVKFCCEQVSTPFRLRLVCMRTWEEVPCGADGYG